MVKGDVRVIVFTGLLAVLGWFFFGQAVDFVSVCYYENEVVLNAHRSTCPLHWGDDELESSRVVFKFSQIKNDTMYRAYFTRHGLYKETEYPLVVALWKQVFLYHLPERLGLERIE